MKPDLFSGLLRLDLPSACGIFAVLRRERRLQALEKRRQEASAHTSAVVGPLAIIRDLKDNEPATGL